MKKVLISVSLSVAAVLTVLMPDAGAAITTIKSSDDFNIKAFEGDSVPTGGDIVLGNVDDWSVSNGVYVIDQDGNTGGAGKNGQFTTANGWTMEVRFKVIDTAAVGDVFQLMLGDDFDGHYTVLGIDEGEVSDLAGGAGTLAAKDLTDGFHVLRYAREAGDGEEKLWLDKVERSLPGHMDGAYNRQWMGDLSGPIDDGKIEVDYFRLDNTGGYAVDPAFDAKSSDDFNIKAFEGDSVPTGGDIVLGNVDDWSVSNGVYVIDQDGNTGGAGKNGQFTTANGWTMEVRFKVIDTAAVGDVFQLMLGDDFDGHYTVLGIDEGEVSDLAGGAGTLAAKDLTDGFHVLRYAREAGDGEEKLWLDKVERSLPGHMDGAYNRQWMGDLSGPIDDGKIEVDYFRLDNTGGYAHVPLPIGMLVIIQ